MGASSVPTAALTAFYANTTGGTVADPALIDAAFAAVVATVNANANAQNELVSEGVVSALGIINVKDYNASGDGDTTTTGSITTGKNVLVVASTSTFAVGQGISIAGAGAAGVALVTTISSIVGTNVFLAANASTTVAGAVVSHDDSLAIQAAVTAIGSDGGLLVFPKGNYIATNFTRPSNVRMVGIEANFVIGGVTIAIPSIANETTGNFTTYVSTTGDDTDNHGLSATYPFSTIQRAVDSLPRNVLHFLTIQLADGTYTDTVETISGGNVSSYTTDMITVNAVFSNITVHEGAMILLKGNATTPSNVVIDGEGTVDKGIFIFECKRVNIQGIKVVDHVFSGIEYKRYSEGQLTDILIDNQAQFGIYAYQYSFMELQSDVTVQNCADSGVSYYFSIGSLSGVTIDACVYGLYVHHDSNVVVSTGTISDCTTSGIHNNRSNVQTTGVTFSGNAIDHDVYGGTSVSTTDTFSSPTTNSIVVEKGGNAIIVTPSMTGAGGATTVSAINVKENGVIYLLNGFIKSYRNGLLVNPNGKVFVEGTEIALNTNDGVNCNGGEIYLKSVVSTSGANTRYGINTSGGTRVTDGGSNALLGSTANYNLMQIVGVIRSGATVSRPTGDFLIRGQSYFDTTLGKTIDYNGSSWIESARWVSVPASATASGTVGDISADASYIYICHATNTWKRVSIAAW